LRRTTTRVRCLQQRHLSTTRQRITLIGSKPQRSVILLNRSFPILQHHSQHHASNPSTHRFPNYPIQNHLHVSELRYILRPSSEHCDHNTSRAIASISCGKTRSSRGSSSHTIHSTTTGATTAYANHSRNELWTTGTPTRRSATPALATVSINRDSYKHTPTSSQSR
jgi:hypothetical protein